MKRFYEKAHLPNQSDIRHMKNFIKKHLDELVVEENITEGKEENNKNENRSQDKVSFDSCSQHKKEDTNSNSLAKQTEVTSGKDKGNFEQVKKSLCNVRSEAPKKNRSNEPQEKKHNHDNPNISASKKVINDQPPESPSSKEHEPKVPVSVVKDIKEILFKNPDGLALHQFVSIFQAEHGRQHDPIAPGFRDMVELLQSMPGVDLRQCKDGDQLVVLNLTDDITSASAERSNTVTDVLCRILKENCSSTPDFLIKEYEIRTCKELASDLSLPSDQDLTDYLEKWIEEQRPLEEDIICDTHPAEAQDDNEHHTLCESVPMRKKYVSEETADRLQKLVGEFFPGGLRISELVGAYKGVYGASMEDLRAENYGLRSLEELLKASPEAVKLHYCLSHIWVMLPHSHADQVKPDVSPGLLGSTTDKYRSLKVEELLPAGAMVEVVVGEVYSPHNFSVIHRGRDTSEALDYLMDRMFLFYSSQVRERYRYCTKYVVVGAPVVALYVDDGNFYRALLIGMEDINTVKLFFVDYGTICLCSMSKLLHIHEQFFQLPAQAIKVSLFGVLPATGRKVWSVAASQRFLQMVQNKALVAQVMDDQYKVFVNLWDTNGTEDLAISDQLITEGWAISTDRPGTAVNGHNISVNGQDIKGVNQNISGINQGIPGIPASNPDGTGTVLNDQDKPNYTIIPEQQNIQFTSINSKSKVYKTSGSSTQSDAYKERNYIQMTEQTEREYENGTSGSPMSSPVVSHAVNPVFSTPYSVKSSPNGFNPNFTSLENQSLTHHAIPDGGRRSFEAPQTTTSFLNPANSDIISRIVWEVMLRFEELHPGSLMRLHTSLSVSHSTSPEQSVANSVSYGFKNRMPEINTITSYSHEGDQADLNTAFTASSQMVKPNLETGGLNEETHPQLPTVAVPSHSTPPPFTVPPPPIPPESFPLLPLPSLPSLSQSFTPSSWSAQMSVPPPQVYDSRPSQLTVPPPSLPPHLFTPPPSLPPKLPPLPVNYSPSPAQVPSQNVENRHENCPNEPTPTYPPPPLALSSLTSQVLPRKIDHSPESSHNEEDLVPHNPNHDIMQDLSEHGKEVPCDLPTEDSLRHLADQSSAQYTIESPTHQAAENYHSPAHLSAQVSDHLETENQPTTDVPSHHTLQNSTHCQVQFTEDSQPKSDEDNHHAPEELNHQSDKNYLTSDGSTHHVSGSHSASETPSHRGNNDSTPHPLQVIYNSMLEESHHLVSEESRLLETEDLSQLTTPDRSDHATKETQIQTCPPEASSEAPSCTRASKLDIPVSNNCWPYHCELHQAEIAEGTKLHIIVVDGSPYVFHSQLEQLFSHQSEKLHPHLPRHPLASQPSYMQQLWPGCIEASEEDERVLPCLTLVPLVPASSLIPPDAGRGDMYQALQGILSTWSGSKKEVMEENNGDSHMKNSTPSTNNLNNTSPCTKSTKTHPPDDQTMINEFNSLSNKQVVQVNLEEDKLTNEFLVIPCPPLPQKKLMIHEVVRGKEISSQNTNTEATHSKLVNTEDIDMRSKDVNSQNLSAQGTEYINLQNKESNSSDELYVYSASTDSSKEDQHNDVTKHTPEFKSDSTSKILLEPETMVEVSQYKIKLEPENKVDVSLQKLKLEPEIKVEVLQQAVIVKEDILQLQKDSSSLSSIDTEFDSDLFALQLSEWSAQKLSKKSKLPQKKKSCRTASEAKNSNARIKSSADDAKLNKMKKSIKTWTPDFETTVTARNVTKHEVADVSPISTKDATKSSPQAAMSTGPKHNFLKRLLHQNESVNARINMNQCPKVVPVVPQPIASSSNHHQSSKQKELPIPLMNQNHNVVVPQPLVSTLNHHLSSEQNTYVAIPPPVVSMLNHHKSFDVNKPKQCSEDSHPTPQQSSNVFKTKNYPEKTKPNMPSSVTYKDKRGRIRRPAGKAYLSTQDSSDSDIQGPPKSKLASAEHRKKLKKTKEVR